MEAGSHKQLGEPPLLSRNKDEVKASLPSTLMGYSASQHQHQPISSYEYASYATVSCLSSTLAWAASTRLSDACLVHGNLQRESSESYSNRRLCLHRLLLSCLAFSPASSCKAAQAPPPATLLRECPTRKQLLMEEHGNIASRGSIYSSGFLGIVGA